MTNKQPNHTSITIRMRTYEFIQTIRKKTPTESGFPPSTPDIMSDIVDFYLEAHPKLKGEA